ncbi:MAG: TerC family protein [Peptococcaceae bacterium]|nr:TerC family protein [Peptococcaceae bacterium]
MEILTLDFCYGILSIILIDLVLGGDNAIVIGMAARNLPGALQKKAIVWGTVGAVIVRVSATFLVVGLLKIPGIQFVGGAVLIWIAYKLLIEEKKEEQQAKGHTGFGAAVGTIVVADISMGMDNIIAVAGAAHNNFSIVIIGLLISIPIVVWGSTLIIKLMDRFPVIVFLGAAVIAYTGGSMMMKDSLTSHYVTNNHVLQMGVAVAIMAGVLVTGKIWKTHRRG